MLSSWLQFAAERATTLGLDFQRIADSHAIVCGAVGQTWLDEQERQQENPTISIAAAHPLFRNLQATTEPAILEICELALYLRTFQNDPTLPSIIQDLRSSKYDPVFLELAFAFRWRDAGADVKLRTATPHGEADFEATINGLPFTVEVSAFPYDAFSSEQFRLAGVVADTLKSALQKATPPVAARLWIERRAEGNHEAAIREAVRAACRAWSAQEDRAAPVSVPAAFGRVEVAALTEADGVPSREGSGRSDFPAGTDWDVVLRAVEKEVTEGQPLYRLVEREGWEYGRVYMKFPAEDRDKYERIAKKLKKEAHQLRGIPTPRVVILDVSGPEFGDVFLLDPERLATPVKRLLREIPELACVFLTMRRWDPAWRYKYSGLFLDNAASIYRLPSTFMRRYSQREWTWDFIADREYPDAADYTAGVADPFDD